MNKKKEPGSSKFRIIFYILPLTPAGDVILISNGTFPALSKLISNVFSVPTIRSLGNGPILTCDGS